MSDFVNLIDIHHAKDVRDLALTFEAGFRGLIHKISEGTWFVDPSAVPRCQVAWDLAFVLGGYHFFRSNVPGAEQAHYFLKALEPIRKITGDRLLPPWLDLETTDSASTAVRMREVLQFLRIVRSEFKLPGVYSSAGFWHSHTGKPSWIKDFWQWLAQWTPAQTYTLPVGWTPGRTRLWQRCIAGRYDWCVSGVPGIRGQVDVNRFLGTLPELRAWAGYGTGPVPQPMPDIEPLLDYILDADTNLDAAIALARDIVARSHTP